VRSFSDSRHSTMNVVHRRRWATSWRSHFDARTAMVALSATGAVPLLAIALISPAFLRPHSLPLLVGVLLFTAATVMFATRVGRLSERQFASLGFGGMAGVAISAYLIADPTGTRAVTSMLAIVPAIAASGSPPRVTAVLTCASVAMATALSIISLSSSGWAVTAVATGAAATAVLVPVVLITSLRRTLMVTNNKLHVLASTDPLTGLANRRGLLHHAQALLNTAARMRIPVSALVIDIDFFKTVNDTAGHTAGDRALIAVAGALTRAVEDAASGAGAAGAVVARTGGEEFLIMAQHRPGTDLAELVLHRIRSECTVTVSIGAVTVDLEHPAPSAGVASVPAEHRANLEIALDEVARAGDAALYLAKSGGRDRACRADTLTLIWPSTVPAERLEIGDHVP
jgi:diguanylate cyclase (GGDEF)-like protein